MKTIRFIAKTIIYAGIAYVLFFGAWLVLATACVVEQGSQYSACGQNSMTDAVVVLYAPLFK